MAEAAAFSFEPSKNNIDTGTQPPVVVIFSYSSFCVPLFQLFSSKVKGQHITAKATHNDNLLSLAAKTSLHHVVGRKAPLLSVKIKLNTAVVFFSLVSRLPSCVAGQDHMRVFPVLLSMSCFSIFLFLF